MIGGMRITGRSPSTLSSFQGPIFARMRWFEPPLLFYFMVHFFPPMPSAIANSAYLLGIIGVVFSCRAGGWQRLSSLRHPLVMAWMAFVILLAIGLLHVPVELRGESLHRFVSDVVKLTIFAVAVLLYLDCVERARRLLFAGMLACLLMLGFCVIEVWSSLVHTGKLPFQRDYLFYLMFFFPFSLVVYRCEPRWRQICLLLAASTIALAFLMGFRGAVLALLVMSVIVAMFAQLWRMLALTMLLLVIGLAVLAFWFPDQAAYAVAKFQQTDSSGRVSGHWLPAWEMSMQAPWFGHGFGRHIFGHEFVLQMDAHPKWTRNWSDRLGWQPNAPHSVFFETLFAAGWPGLLLLGATVFGSLFAMARAIWQRRHNLFSNPWISLSLAIFVACVGSFCVFYQTEDPSWRTVPVALMISAGCLTALRNPENHST